MNASKTPPIEKPCLVCGKIFKTCSSKVNRGEGKYCCVDCYRKSTIKRIDVVCQVCGKKRSLRFSRTRKGRGKYCSIKCRIDSLWRGGEKISRQRKYKKYKNNIKHRLRMRMSSSFSRYLKHGVKAGKKWEDLSGYSVVKLKRHLTKTMPHGYTWQDFLDGGLHIDHIIPVVEFHFSSPNDLQFKACWALNNLRLLPKKENLSKNKKLIKSFQLTLPI